MRFMLAIVFSFLVLRSVHAVFVKVNGIEKTAVYRVRIGLDDSKVYAVSSNTFFKSEDGGVEWRNVFVSKAEEIKDIYVDKYLYDTVYIVTESSLYRFSGTKKEKIFSLPSEVEGICIYKYKGMIYVGTTDGIYYASEDFLKWSRLKGFPRGVPVYSICGLPKVMFIASNNGVYTSDEKGGFVRRFVLKKVDVEESSEDGEEGIVCRKIVTDIFNPEKVYLGTSKGLFVSFDKGKSWQRVIIPLIYNANIRDINQSYAERKNIYLATDKGIFSVDIDNNTIRPLFEGLDTKDIFGVDFNRKGILFVATSKGLFSYNRFTQAKSWGEIDELCKNEPSIREVQEAALIYNEVDPSKIQKWRSALKYRAFFPSVSLDYDKTVYGSSSGSFAVGPRDWGVSFSWDIGNLIWNSYEDDVDTRSRLVTQLRVNILDDVNTTYFERLRVKQRLLSDDYKNDNEKFKDEIRLRELTASLDGYTGGYFSRRVRKLKEKSYNK